MTELLNAVPGSAASGGVSAPYRRGDIYYVINISNDENGDPKPGRPAIIVSSDKTNAASDYVEVVYLTTQPKPPMPTHVTLIDNVGRTSTALCESVYTIRKDRLGQFMRHLLDEDMHRTDTALMVSLGIAPVSGENGEDVRHMREELAFYKRMTDELIARLQKGRTVSFA